MATVDLEPGWLTRVLQTSLATDAVVTAADRTSIGTGQVGENVRVGLTWSDATTDLPASVVAKLPSSSDVSRATAVQLHTYLKEVGFYRDLQHAVSIRTPRIHAIEWDADTHDFVILMEDIRPASPGDQLAGCGLDEARWAIDQVVGLHGPTWGSADEHGLAWLQPLRGVGDVAARAQMFELLTPGFMERFRFRLAPEVLEVGNRVVTAFAAWHATVTEWAENHHAWCIVHGDYRLDNMLFGSPPSSPALTVVDWQTVSIGTGPADVAYFLGAGLLPDVRENVERGLVERYAAGLRHHGIDISDDAVWEGYVLGSATGYFMAVLASQIVEQTERGDEMFATMAERHADQIEAVGLLERLERRGRD